MWGDLEVGHILHFSVTAEHSNVKASMSLANSCKARQNLWPSKTPYSLQPTSAKAELPYSFSPVSRINSEG